MNAIPANFKRADASELYWAAACGFGPKGFTVRQLFERSETFAVRSVRHWIERMVECGVIAVIERRDVKPRGQLVYAVARPTKKAPPNPYSTHGRQQQHLWTAMRTLSTFSLGELAAAASTDEVVVSRLTAFNYVRFLTQANVLIVVRSARRKTLDSGLYRLRKAADTGPLAPSVVGARLMFDRNTGIPLSMTAARS